MKNIEFSDRTNKIKRGSFVYVKASRPMFSLEPERYEKVRVKRTAYWHNGCEVIDVDGESIGCIGDMFLVKNIRLENEIEIGKCQ